MALAALFLGAYAIVVQIIVLEKNTALTGKIWIIAAILNLVISLLLIPYTGIIGGAIATLISFAFVFIITSYYANKSIKISFSLKFIAKCLASSMVMTFLLLILRPEGVAGLALSVAIGALIYFIVLLVLKGFTKEEIAFIRTLRYNK